MSITLRRTLIVCVVAAALALALALVSTRDVSAAPPESVDFAFTDTSCGFPVGVEVSGKNKFKELPGGRFISTNPGLRNTLTNLDQPTHQVTYVITGAAHVTELSSGELFVVFTGRNIFSDPSYGILLTMGRFTQVIDPETGASPPPEGTGRVIDVCERLA